MLSPRDVDLVVLGDCNPDVLVLGGDVTPVFGQQEKLVGSIGMVIGGSAAISAVAAARLGLRVALVAAVGADRPGAFMLDQLAAEGVDVRAVAVRADTPTGMTVALSQGGDRAILTALGAVASLTAADVPAARLARARHVHASSYFLLEDSLGPGLAGLLSAARAAGATTSLDTNWDPSGRWGDERLSAAIAQADVLLPNEAEALRLSGATSLAGAAEILTATGSRLVVKLGERGALCADGPVLHQVSLPPVAPVDATGAGDCFNAGLIAGLLEGLALPEATALGCAAGALSTRAPGGTASSPDSSAAAQLAKLASVTSVVARRALYSRRGQVAAAAGYLRSRRRAARPDRPRHIFLIAMYRRASGSPLATNTPRTAPTATISITVTYPSARIIFLLLMLDRRSRRRPMRF
jgi:sugar/nucleoside kinase (ribokinase family)